VQLTIDRISAPQTDERAARRALRRQVAKLERELAEIVASCFPHVVSSPPAADTVGGPPGGPCLLDLGGLERARDELASRIQAARRAVAERAELETRSRELLRRMQQDPARYKFARLPVTDLGERGCGVWEVRPRLGLIGMLAGWWQVKLSSGCPLAGGRAAGAALSHDRQRPSIRVESAAVGLVSGHGRRARPRPRPSDSCHATDAVSRIAARDPRAPELQSIAASVWR
jgi:hypothetical protein